MEQLTVPLFEDAIGLWAHLKRQYAQHRGSDPDENRKAIPRTTCGDVRQLMQLWDAELAKVDSNAVSAQTERQRWKRCKQAVTSNLHGRPMAVIYPDNRGFWHCVGRLAIYLENEKIAPSSWRLLVESVKEAAVELPETLTKAAVWVASKAKPEAGTFRTGLYIAGGLGGLWLLSKALK